MRRVPPVSGWMPFLERFPIRFRRKMQRTAKQSYGDKGFAWLLDAKQDRARHHLPPLVRRQLLRSRQVGLLGNRALAALNSGLDGYGCQTSAFVYPGRQD